MSKDLEYFKDFLEDPVSFNIPRFYAMLHEWAEYIKTHKGEFDYIEDENWREIRERIIAAFHKKEEITAEFEKVSLNFEEMTSLDNDDDKLVAYKEWMEFMKKYQVDYAFTDEDIALNEMMLNNLIASIHNSKVAEESAKEAELKAQQALKNLDNAIFETYERTGKRPVLTALPVRKDNKGN